MSYVFDGEELWRCPLRPFLEDPSGYNHLLLSSWYYREGHFPEAGTWMDQSARLLEFFQIMTQAEQDAEASLEEQRKRKNAKSGRK